MSFFASVKRVIRTRFRRIPSTLFVIVIVFLATLLLLNLFPVSIDEDKSVKNKRNYISEKVIRNKVYVEFKENIIGNFEPKEPKKTGRPGDEGKSFNLHNEENIDWAKVESLKSQYGMNMVASNMIPMDRSIPDLRHEECKYWHYKEPLPTASVVIVFHNEGFSTLLRTVHSVLIRSPRSYLREVVLVDDYSDKKPLKNELEEYILEHFGEYKKIFNPNKYRVEEGKLGEKLGEKSGKVRLVRNSERSGLINSRTRGANEAVGDVIVFLDAHCEVSYSWLPPLLAPIAVNRKTVTVPVIDGIDSDNFHVRPVYSSNRQHFKGIWEWGMYYKEIEIDMDKHLKTHRISEPYDSPTHAGGLFAIERDFFLTLGGYDPGLLVWGGENFELSFKVWQCGGRLQWVPCSRVGHIYRGFMPYSFGNLASKRKDPLIMTNYKRVIEVWWDDEYKNYFYTREPLAKFYDQGDISSQLKLKNSLKCKSFSWFMDEVGYDVYRNFPKLPPNLEWGEVENEGLKKCLDTPSTSPPQRVQLNHCHHHGGNQLYRLNSEGQLGVGERCIEGTRDRMTLVFCKLGTVNGPWKYLEKSKHFMHKNLNLCLDVREDESIFLNTCNTAITQQWNFNKIKPRGH